GAPDQKALEDRGRAAGARGPEDPRPLKSPWAVRFAETPLPEGLASWLSPAMSKQKGILSALAAVLFVACGGPEATPPKYPYPEPTPVEDTELGVYLEEEELEDELDAEEAEEAADDAE